jgi:hypothetical protein
MKYYCFGNTICRGDVLWTRTSFDSEQAIQYLNLYKKYIEAGRSNDTKEPISLIAINLLSFDCDKDLSKIDEQIKQIQNGESFWKMGEEELFGYGTTKEQAKQEFFKAEIGDDSDWRLDDSNWS